MLPIPVLANRITHLTDARYFAAWHVDAISFPMDGPHAIRPQKAAQIKEWLEGPTVYFRYEGTSLEHILDHRHTSILDGVILAGSSYLSQLNHIPAEMPLLLELPYALSRAERGRIDSRPVQGLLCYPSSEKPTAELRKWWKEQTAPTYLYYQGQEVPTLPSILDTYALDGLVVEGGDEEKVGYKSFDQLDQLYDFLLDEWS